MRAVLGARVGVTRAPVGPLRQCQRCGIRREARASSALCRDCMDVLRVGPA